MSGIVLPAAIVVLIAAALGLAVGAIAAGLIVAGRFRAKLDEERRGRVAAQTRLEEAQRHMEDHKSEQARLLDQAQGRLTDTFKALSGDALRSNSEAFLDAARRTLEILLTDARGELVRRHEGIEALVRPLREALTRYEEHLREIERSRQEAYGGLKRHLESLGETHRQLQKETGSLATALRTPQVRGRWGEITLQRVVEVAGMSSYCDFRTQPDVATADGRIRPDLTVHLPGQRTVVVDAKTPLTAYMEAMEAEDEGARSGALVRHAQSVRTHMQALGMKAYWRQFQPAPEFVVMFLPGESLFSAALEQDRRLIEDGIASRVILATPTTLIALLRTVAYSWQQQKAAENARRIVAAGRDLYERICAFAGHMMRLREGLEKANQSFNAAVGSWESRLAPGARRLRELGAAAAEKEPPELAPAATALRASPQAEPEAPPEETQE